MATRMQASVLRGREAYATLSSYIARLVNLPLHTLLKHCLSKASEVPLGQQGLQRFKVLGCYDILLARHASHAHLKLINL